MSSVGPRLNRAGGVALISDSARLAGVLAGHLVTRLMPQTADPTLAAVLARARGTGTLPARMNALLAGPSPEAFTHLAADHVLMRCENTVGRLRDIGERRWRPEVELHGAHHLRTALQSGRGALLWRMAFCSAPMVNATFWRAGFPVVHLSRPAHGAAARSLIGYKALGPLYVRAEAWYLKRRVLIPEDGSVGFMKDLINELGDNAVVSIFGEQVGRQNVIAPFFRTTKEFATGAPSLAHRTGAALLTVDAERLSPFRYRVHVREPITIPEGVSRREAVEAAVHDFSRRLEHRVREAPASWTGWG